VTDRSWPEHRCKRPRASISQLHVPNNSKHTDNKKAVSSLSIPGNGFLS
jgi:hypothetical protein